MNARPATTGITIAAGIASFVGPTFAVLREMHPFLLFANASLLELWLLAAIGAIGASVGVFAFRKGRKFAGIVCFVTNVPVLALYGFIAVFFATGGSR